MPGAWRRRAHRFRRRGRRLSRRRCRQPDRAPRGQLARPAGAWAGGCARCVAGRLAQGGRTNGGVAGTCWSARPVSQPPTPCWRNGDYQSYLGAGGRHSGGEKNENGTRGPHRNACTAKFSSSAKSSQQARIFANARLVRADGSRVRRSARHCKAFALSRMMTPRLPPGSDRMLSPEGLNVTPATSCCARSAVPDKPRSSAPACW